MISIRPSRSLPILVFCIILLSCGCAEAAPITIKARRLDDGVILWTPSEPYAKKARFFVMFQDMAKVLLPSNSGALPFDRSIAFLIGVSKYRNLESLPFVENDLRDMKDYLLLRGGFDQVYVASNEVVSHDLIENYMMNKF